MSKMCNEIKCAIQHAVDLINNNINSRAVTIHQTHDSVRITIFDPRFGSYHDFFVGGWEKKKERFLKQYFLLNNI